MRKLSWRAVGMKRRFIVVDTFRIVPSGGRDADLTTTDEAPIFQEPRLPPHHDRAKADQRIGTRHLITSRPIAGHRRPSPGSQGPPLIKPRTAVPLLRRWRAVPPRAATRSFLAASPRAGPSLDAAP